MLSKRHISAFLALVALPTCSALAGGVTVLVMLELVLWVVPRSKVSVLWVFILISLYSLKEDSLLSVFETIVDLQGMHFLSDFVGSLYFVAAQSACSFFRVLHVWNSFLFLILIGIICRGRCIPFVQRMLCFCIHYQSYKGRCLN